MRNERGITLVELLAVLALSGIILILLISVFINGSKATERSATNQRLQQEANYITEVVRAEYLKHPDKVIAEGNNRDIITLTIEDNVLKMNEKVISEGYQYTITPATISRTGSPSIALKIEKNTIEFKVDVRFSKLE